MARLRLKVKEIAEGKNLSMAMVSHKSLLTINTVRSIYRNPYRTVNTDTLVRLADALEVSVFDLLEEVPDEDVPDLTKKASDQDASEQQSS